MYLQVDGEGHHHQFIHEIVDHKKDNSAIDKSYAFKRGRNGNRVPKMAKRVWKLLVEL